MTGDGVHEEEVAVKTVMVESAEGNLEEDTQPPFPKVCDTGTGNRKDREGGQLLDLVHLDRHGVLVHTTPSIAVSADGVNKTYREPDEKVDLVLPGNPPEIATITADEVARVQHDNTPVRCFVEGYPWINRICDFTVCKQAPGESFRT